MTGFSLNPNYLNIPYTLEQFDNGDDYDEEKEIENDEEIEEKVESVLDSQTVYKTNRGTINVPSKFLNEIDCNFFGDLYIRNNNNLIIIEEDCMSEEDYTRIGILTWLGEYSRNVNIEIPSRFLGDKKSVLVNLKENSSVKYIEIIL